MATAPCTSSSFALCRGRGRGQANSGFSFGTTLLDKRASHPDLLLPQLALVRGPFVVRAKHQHDEAALPDEQSTSPPPASPPPKQSLLEALDFAAIRSEEDAQLLDDARSATSMGQKMSREQYAALRRKVGGTYKDFFKDSIEVEGEFVDEGWVDKSCRYCKKDTASELRIVDKFGRYAHVSCLEKSKSGNFFTRLFGM
ncbi:hypothetical protein L7F22_015556 [Adiantum nelumboides]|nr:hypothetical protein [Adiantum nelumboides]